MTERTGHRPEPKAARHPSRHAHAGKGGTREGYRAANEIEDMEIFDADPGKHPSPDQGGGAKSIDDRHPRERK
jgi:hypothetical protein